MAKADLTAQRLRELLSYNPDTGEFSWLRAVGSRGQLGPIKNRIHSTGYLRIRVDRDLWLAHRLAWLYMTGKQPTAEIDHVNGIRHDNRFANLRDVPRKTNAENRTRAQKDSVTGLLGVSHSFGRFSACVKVNGKTLHLGQFDTPEAARAAYLAAKREHHPGCTI